jgi:hypothetical protein
MPDNKRSNNASSGALHRCEFLAESQAHGALQPHRPEFGLRPRRGGHRRMKVAAGERHRAQTEAAAQHHRHHRHAQRRRGDEHAAGMAQHPLRLRHRPNHEARRVDQRDQWMPGGIGQLHETRQLVATGHVERPGQVAWVGSRDRHRMSAEPRQHGDDAQAIQRASSITLSRSASVEMIVRGSNTALPSESRRNPVDPRHPPGNAP